MAPASSSAAVDAMRVTCQSLISPSDRVLSILNRGNRVFNGSELGARSGPAALRRELPPFPCVDRRKGRPTRADEHFRADAPARQTRCVGFRVAAGVGDSAVGLSARCREGASRFGPDRSFRECFGERSQQLRSVAMPRASVHARQRGRFRGGQIPEQDTGVLRSRAMNRDHSRCVRAASGQRGRESRPSWRVSAPRDRAGLMGARNGQRRQSRR